MLGEAIVAAARGCLGTPFRHQGRTPGMGLDCAGLAVHCARANGLPVFDVAGYADRPQGRQLEDALDAQPCLRRIALHEIAPGDLLLMRFSGDPQHLAIYGGSTIIHAYVDARKVCEHGFTAEWRGRVARCYRFVEGA